MIATLCTGLAERGAEHEEFLRYLRDVGDHLTQIIERVDELRLALRDMLTVNATLVAQQQNEEMRRLSEASNVQNEEVKKISAWAAILFAPTLIGHAGGPPLDRPVSHTVVVDELERTPDAEGLETAHIVGNSLGGHVALQLAARGRARSVVALAPAACPVVAC